MVQSGGQIDGQSRARWPALALAALLWTQLLAPPVSLHAATAAAHNGTPPPLKLEERIPVAPLGYQPPGQLYLLARMSSNSLDFIDSTRLLFTFHAVKLLRREPSVGWPEDAQTIHAMVLDLPSGHVSASADWRMRDRDRYLWPLGEGRFLVRQGNLYSTVDASLALKPWLTAPSAVVETEVSPGGHRLVSEEQYERHTPEQHEKLVQEAEEDGTVPPSEDALINVIDLDNRTVLGRVRVDSPLDVPVVNGGYLAPAKGTDDNDYVIRFVSFAGKEVTLGDVQSTCLPRETFLNDSTVLIESCGPNTPDVFLDAWTIDGKKLWSGRRDGHEVWPTYALARNGSRFAVASLRIFHPINLDDSLEDQNVEEQVVQVFDVSTGALLASVNASPILSAGQNFALSPDGTELAVLRNGAVEVYALPSLPGLPEKAAAGQRQTGGFDRAPR